jgi:hypothetical protein
MTPSPPTLEYAPRPSHRWWKRHRRKLLIVSIFLALAAAGYAYRDPIWFKARQLYWARRCARFAVPAGTPVVRPVGSTTDANYRVADYTPPARALTFQPECWTEFAALNGWRPRHYPFTYSTVFLHELRTPSGKRRIVHVESVFENLFRPASHLVPTIVAPPTVFSPPRVIREPTGDYRISEAHAAMKRYVGQYDPRDVSHFTIAFESTGSSRSGVVDGYLRDDDTVTFEVRDVATKPPSE